MTSHVGPSIIVGGDGHNITSSGPNSANYGQVLTTAPQQQVTIIGPCVHVQGDVLAPITNSGSNTASTIGTNENLKSAPKRILFAVLSADTNFTGRENELRDLDALLDQKNTSDVVVCGLGGIGKTQLVQRYIEKFGEAKFEHIIWISAENESLISECFTKLAEDHMNISCVNASGKPKSIESIVTDVYAELSKTSSLIIFDNIECVDHIRSIDLRKTIPKSSIRPKVVITSRIQEWGKHLLIRLGTWMPEEAEEFISKILEIGTSADVEGLAERLQFFPLALRQATSYIAYERKRDDVTIASYLQIYDNRNESIKAELLKSLVFQKDPDNKYTKTTFTTWSITVATIAENHEYGALAIKILNTIAFFAPQTIRRDLLFYLDKDENELKRKAKVKSAVSLLVEYSMIDAHERQTILQIHKLVQEVIRLKLSQERQDKIILRNGLQLFRDDVLRFEYAAHAATFIIHAGKYSDCLGAMKDLPNAIFVNLVCGSGRSEAKRFAEILLELYEEVEDGAFIEELEFHLRFAKAVLLRSDFKYVHLFKVECDKKLKSIGERDSETLAVQFQIGFLLKESEKFAEALNILYQVYRVQNEMLGEADVETLRTKRLIGLIHLENKNWTEASEIMRDTIEKEKQLLGESHADTLLTKRYIGQIHFARKELVEAMGIFEEVLAKQNESLGESHQQDTLTTMRYIGRVHFERKEWVAAMHTFEEVFAKQNFSLGEYHYDTLSTRRYIGRIHFERRKWTEARHYFEEVFAREKISLGPCHQNTLLSRSYIGRIHFERKEWDEAMGIFKEVYAKQKTSLGEHHQDTLLTRHDMGRVYIEIKEFDEAMNIFEEVFAKQNDALGECHQNTLLTKHDMGQIQLERKEWVKAMDIFEDVFSKQKNLLGEFHQNTLLTRFNIGRIHFERKKWSKAIGIFEEVFLKQTESLGECHKDTLSTRRYIGRIHFERREWNDAMAIFEEVCGKQRTSLGECHQNTLSTRRYIGRIHLERREWSDAQDILEDIFAKEKASLGDCHQNTLLSRQYIGRLHFKKEEWNEAIDIFKEIFPKQKASLGKNHQSTLLTSHYIGRIHYATEKWAEALEVFEDIFAIEKTLLGNCHPNTLTTRNCIGKIYMQTMEWDEAMGIFEEILSKKMISLGEYHRSTQSTRYYIGQIHFETEKWDKAIVIFEDIFAKQKDLLGECHQETLLTKHYIEQTIEQMKGSCV